MIEIEYDKQVRKGIFTTHTINIYNKHNRDWKHNCDKHKYNKTALANTTTNTHHQNSSRSVAIGWSSRGDGLMVHAGKASASQLTIKGHTPMYFRCIWVHIM